MFRIFVYKPQPDLPEWAKRLEQHIRASPFAVDDPVTACLLVAFVADSDGIRQLKHWQAHGRNHLLISVGPSTPNTTDTQAAMVVAERVQ